MSLQVTAWALLFAYWLSDCTEQQAVVGIMTTLLCTAVCYDVCYLQLSQERDCLRKKMKGIYESHRHSASFQIIQLGQHLQYDYIPSNQRTRKDWML